METNKKHFNQAPSELANANKKTLGFEVPEDYFAKMQSKVIQTMEEEKAKSKLVAFPWKALSAAAVVILLFAIGFNKWYFSTPETNVVVESENVEYTPNEIQDWMISTLMEDEVEVKNQINEKLIEQWVIEEVKKETKTEEAILNTVLEDKLESQQIENEVLDQLTL